MRFVLSVAAIPLIVAMAACSTKDFYVSSQEWQRNECRKIPDQAERQRCLSSTARSYESYKAEADKARSN